MMAKESGDSNSLSPPGEVFVRQ